MMHIIVDDNEEDGDVEATTNEYDEVLDVQLSLNATWE